MADDIRLNAGINGDTVRAKEINGIKYQAVQNFAQDARTVGDGLNTFLSEDGLGVNTEMIGDYTGGGVGTTVFSIKPANGDYHIYSSGCITLLSVGQNEELFISKDVYGGKNSGTLLTNGIKIQFRNVSDDQVVLELPEPIKQHRDWEQFFGGNTTIVDEDAGATHYLRTCTTFGNFYVGGAGGLYLALELSDDFSSTALTSHKMLLSGLRMDPDTFERHFVRMSD